MSRQCRAIKVIEGHHRFHCSRDAGHQGKHQARGINGVVMRAWVQKKVAK